MKLYISGPCTYREYKIGERNIHIFGENHETTPEKRGGECIDLIDILKIVIRRNNKKYDIFVENEIQTMNNDSEFYKMSNSKVINDIRGEFSSCMMYNKSCQYRNIRVHNTDFRRVFKSSNNTWYKYMSNFYRNPIYILNKEGEVSKNKAQKTIRIVGDMLNNARIKKQYENIKDKTERNNILNFFNMEYRQLSNQLLSATQNNEIYKAGAATLTLFGLVMDKYGIGRMFRNFEAIRLSEYGEEIYNGRSENIIYYCGEGHAKIINKLMKFLNARQVYAVNDGIYTKNITHIKIETEKTNLFREG